MNLLLGHFRWVLIVTLFMAALPTTAFAAGPSIPAGSASSTELLIGFEPGADLRAAVRGLPGEPAVLYRLGQRGVALVRVASGDQAAAERQLADVPGVRYVELNRSMEGTWTPNDPYFSDPTKVYAPQQIKAPQAWDVVRGASSVVVAVVDSGVDFNHPELANSLWTNPAEVAGNGIDDDGNGYVDDNRGWDFVGHDNLAQDELGHGTHVAGIIGAGTDNGIGIAGVAGGVKVLPVRVLNASNQGTWADIAAGIVYAADLGVRAINLSLGGTIFSTTVQDAVQYAQSRGVLVIAAAGNNASDQVFYPAAYDAVVGVAATTIGGSRWTLSNYGANVDVAAPGATVYSTYWSGGTSTYQFMSGTSMATPAVVGVAALLWSLNQQLTAGQVASMLTSTARDLGDAGWDVYYGNGEVNAYAAVVQAQATLPSSGIIQGVVWLDKNGDGTHALNEVQAIPGITVRVLNQSSGALLEAVSDAAGSYSFSELTPGEYLVAATVPSGFVATTPSETSVALGVGMATSADFGFIMPTASPLWVFEAVTGEQSIELVWQAAGAPSATGYQVVRSAGENAPRKRVNPQPVTAESVDQATTWYRYIDTAVQTGITYWYWLVDLEDGTEFGPVQGVAEAVAVPTLTHVAYMPFGAR